jgi:TolB-like protein/Flp pilus assembly protein TadD
MAISDPSEKLDILCPKQVGLVRIHLKEVLASHAFAGSKRTQDFLHLIVGHALEGEFDSLRERMIGAEMFGRPIDYDTGSDSVVRVKATDVRKKLAQFYNEAKEKPAVRIELPTGSYVPRFVFEPLETTAPSGAEALPSASVNQAAAPLEESSGEGPVAPVTAEHHFFAQRLRRAPRILAGVVFGLALIVVIGFAGFKRWYGNSHARPEIRSIAILPLTNLSGDPGQEYFANGMTEELINDLGQVSTLRVISFTSSMSYKGTKKNLPEIARELAVTGVVEGSVQREGNQERISAQLIDAKTDRPIWAHTYVRDMTSILELQGEVAQAIADEISINVTPQEQARLARKRPINPEAQDLYLHGMLEFDVDNCKKAIDYFRQALDKNPNYAQAHAALANCYGRMGESGQMNYKEAFSQQKAEAIRAIELDESLPEGHAELANTAMTLDWDWATAATEFRRALELNPNSAAIHQKYAFYLLRTGQLREALSEVERGVDLDPVSGRSFHYEGFVYYFSRQYDLALSLSRRVRAESITAFLKSGNGPDALGHLGNAYARAGQADMARKNIAQLEDQVRKNGVGRYEIALVYAGLGRKQEAFKWLEEAYNVHDVGLVYLKIDPCLDPLRSDSRFDDLVRRVGFAK